MVVIIGILAAIAIPKFANTKDKAYVAAMKSDLRNLATYEEQYAADNNGAYFAGTATMAAPLQGFTPVAERDHYRRDRRRPAPDLDRDRDALAVCEDLRQLDWRDRLHLTDRAPSTKGPARKTSGAFFVSDYRSLHISPMADRISGFCSRRGDSGRDRRTPVQAVRARSLLRSQGARAPRRCASRMR